MSNKLVHMIHILPESTSFLAHTVKTRICKIWKISLSNFI